MSIRAWLPLVLLSLAQDDAAERASPAPTASERHVAWHARDFAAVVHLGLPTFAELGSERGDPDLFHPRALDVRQWFQVADASGMASVVLVARHDDGFCLWPSEATEFDVAASRWSGGRGDVVGDLTRVGREMGRPVGLELSLVGPEAQLRAQVEELLERYGPLERIVFTPSGGGSDVPVSALVPLIRELAPETLIESPDGPDLRSTAGALAPDARVAIDGAWTPGVGRASLRPSWYWRPSEKGEMAPLARIVELWEETAGRGGQLLMELPVDRTGTVVAEATALLMEFRRWRDATFDRDRTLGAHVSATSTRDRDSAAANVVDVDAGTPWIAEEGARSATLTLTLAEPARFDRVMLTEPPQLGERIDQVAVEVRDGADWVEVARASGVGPRRILAFPFVEAARLRVHVRSSGGPPALGRIGVFATPPGVRVVAPESCVFLDRTTVELACDWPDAEIYYSLDGIAPSRRSLRYEGPIEVSGPTRLLARAFAGRVFGVGVTERLLWGVPSSELLTPVSFLRAPDPGLAVDVFEGRWSGLEAMLSAEPASSAVTDDLDWTSTRSGGLVARGHLSVPADGVYAFHALHDGALRLRVGDRLVLASDRPGEDASGAVGLRAGFHPIRIEWWRPRDGRLAIEMESAGRARGPVPPGDLYR